MAAPDRSEHKSSFATLRRARDFYSAARLVQEHAGSRFSHPAQFLVAQALELALKAFLLASDVPEDDLAKRHLGHDLRALLDLAKQHELGAIAVDLWAVEIAVDSAAPGHTRPFIHRYVQLGTQDVADMSWMFAAVGVLIRGIHDFCLRHLLGEEVHRSIRDGLPDWPCEEEVAQRIRALPKDCCDVSGLCDCIRKHLDQREQERNQVE